MTLTQISTAGVKDDAVTAGKIPANAVGSSELADNAVDTNAIQDDAVTADKLANSINTAIAANTAKDLTALSAANLTSGTIPDARLPATLPAISGANLTNLPANRVGRNLIQNGSFIVHQRGGTSTAQGFHIDRWYAGHNNSTVTISQGTETSGTVYEKGLVNYYRVTNTANSTASNTYRYIRHSIEAQDLLKSGWNYKSASAKITLSFYVRSSVAQNFYGYLRLTNSPDSKYVFETGSLTANTWTKVTKVISGYTSANINNDNSTGIQVIIAPFWGTDFTASGVALNTWAAWNSGERAPDYATTWAGTDGATFDVTGVQLEVSSVATDFEHRSFAQELALCQRYFQTQYAFTANDPYWHGYFGGGNGVRWYQLPVTMRTYPNITLNSHTQVQVYESSGWADRTVSYGTSDQNRVLLYINSTTHNHGKLVRLSGGSIYPIFYASAEI